MVWKNLGSSGKRVFYNKNLFKWVISFSEMNKWLELGAGLVLLIATIWIAWASSAYSWVLFGKDINLLHSAWIFLKGGIFWFVVMIALLFILLGVNDLRE